MSTWFAIDLISSLPYTWFLAWSVGVSIRQIETDDADSSGLLSGAIASMPQLLRMLKIAKLLKMLKLLRIMKIKKLLIKFEEHIVSDQMNLIVTFMNITIMLVFTAHYMGCIFFYIGIEELRNDP